MRYGPWLLLVACHQSPAECSDTQETERPGFLYGEDLPTFRLELDDAAIAGLATSAREDPPDVPAQFGFEDQSWPVSVHLRGHRSFRPFEEKPAWKIDFEQDGAFFGLRHLSLNNMVSDPSMLAEELVYRLYETMGLPAPRFGYACLNLNDRPTFLYGIVETMDADFVREQFVDPGGNLYEGSEGADFSTADYPVFQNKYSGGDPPFDDLARFSTALEQTPDDGLMHFFELHFPENSLFLAFALEIVVGQADGYVSRRNNFHVYHEPGPDHWWLLPWGMDQAWRNEVGPEDPIIGGGKDRLSGVLYQRCARVEACLEAVDQALLEVVDALETSELLLEGQGLRDRLRLLSRHDPGVLLSPDQVATEQREVLAYLRRRPSQIRRALKE
jgi:CotH kinase protein